MANPSDTLLSATELREQLTSGLDQLPDAETHEEFSERLDNFLEQNDIEESEIISGESKYAPILSEATFNGLDFRGMEGTGLSLADAHHMMNDPAHRMEMAEKFLTGNEENRIENEYSELDFNPYDPYAPTFRPMSAEGIEALEEAVKTKEFMHYELRDALNAGPEGAPETLDDFEQSRNRDEWTPMLGDQAAFHQNGEAEDLKFIHPDGREVVYDGDTNELMTSDAHMGTYNYVNATIPSDATPGIIDTIQNIQTEGSVLHKNYDVEPWVEMGNTRADRYENGGELGRQAQLYGSAAKGAVNSLGNDAHDIGNAVSNKASEVGDAISDKASEVGDAISDTVEDLKNFGKSPWQEGALSPDLQNLNGAHIQQASLSETETPTRSETMSLEDAIGMLLADQKALNASSAGEQTSTVQDALNHPDAAQMFQNLHTHGVKTLTAEITPDMSAEDRVSEILIAGQEATQKAGIPMPSEHREPEVTLEQSNSFEDDYSYGL